MAMNQAAYQAQVLAYLDANLKPLFSNLTNTSDIKNLDFDTVWGIITTAISLIVPYIQATAQCNGLDSHGDTHGSVGII